MMFGSSTSTSSETQKINRLIDELGALVKEERETANLEYQRANWYEKAYRTCQVMFTRRAWCGGRVLEFPS